MKRKSDNLADSFATDESEGWLARLLADEEELDNRAKWRLASWGAGSLGAIVIAILAGQAASDRTREQVASADLARQSQSIQQLAKESRNESSRLAAAIENLNGDRDRLYAKLGSLEQGLDSVTGSIARTRATPQLPSIPADRPVEKRTDRPAANAAEAPANMAAAQPELVPAESRPARPTEVKPEPKAPEVNSAAALASTTKPVTAVPAQEPPAARPVATTVIPGAATPLPTPASERTASASSASLVASRSMLAPPDGAAGRLVEAPPPSLAPQAAAPVPAAAALSSAATDDDDDDTPETAAVPVPRTEFGVDLGSAGSVEGLRVLWVKLARIHKELKPLRPVIMVKDQGRGAQLRLVAGPLGDAAAAAKLCAALGSTDRSCETAVYDGQRLPMASAAPPPRPRKRVPKLTSFPEPLPPPPPPPAQAVAPQTQPQPQPQAQAQPASFTNFFGIRPQPSQ